MPNDTQLDINTLESWLWECACKIRGEVDAQKLKDYILPLIFLKRLSDVYEHELNGLVEEFGDRDTVQTLKPTTKNVFRHYREVLIIYQNMYN